MHRDPNTVPLSRAQIEFLDLWVPAQLFWARTSGTPIGAVPERRQRRTMTALIRKDVVTPDGQVTKSGLNAWRRATKQTAQHNEEFTI